MRYVVLKPLVFGGLSYEVGQEIDIFEKSISQNCLERGLIGEIDKTTTAETPENTENQGEKSRQNKSKKQQK